MADQLRPPSAMNEPDDQRLVAALSDLGRVLAYPDPAGVGRAVRARIEALPPPATPWWQGLIDGARTSRSRPLRRSLVLALIALLLAAAVVGAAILGLPGLRIVVGPAPVSLPPSATAGSPGPTTSATPSASGALTVSPTPVPPLGSSLDLGVPAALADLDATAGFHVQVPTDPGLGPPDQAWYDRFKSGGVVTLLWRARPGWPPTDRNGIGLLLMEFRGSLDEGYFEKVVHQGIDIEHVTVAGDRGFWVAGEPHFFFWVGPDGQPVDDSIRLAGRVLAWESGRTTLRMESLVGKTEALRLAEGLR